MDQCPSLLRTWSMFLRKGVIHILPEDGGRCYMFSLVLNEGIAPRVPTRGQYRKGKNAAEPALSPVFSRSLARLSSLGVSVSPVVAALFLWSPSFLEPSIGNYLCMYVPPSPVQVKTKRFLCDLLIKCVHASWRMTREFQSSPFSITFA